MITELRCSATNCCLIHGSRSLLLFDTGPAGSLPALESRLAELGLSLCDIGFVLISHYHPDHMGTARHLAERGAVIAAADVQAAAASQALDSFTSFTVPESREFLSQLGISGEVFHTPGHTDDSISLWLDEDKTLLTGDLDLSGSTKYKRGSAGAQSRKRMLALKPELVIPGHGEAFTPWKPSQKTAPSDSDVYGLVKRIMKLIDKGVSLDRISAKTGADSVFVQDIARMYLTHQNVGVQGILDRIEIKGK